MNTFKINRMYSPYRTKPRGRASLAAKAAFEDMRRDKSMWVHVEMFGCADTLTPAILTEDILCEL